MKKHTMQTLDLSYMNAVPARSVLHKADELHLYLVGSGGTGSWLAPDIARLAVEFRHQWKQVHVTFIDHDNVERANIPRQNFCHAELGANKAEALAARYGPAWGIEIAVIPQPLQPTMIADSWRGVSLIIGCVDNAAARKTIAETLKRNSTAQPSTWWLDCGNHAQSGQVLLGSTADPKMLAHAFDVPTFCTALPSPALQHPELLKPLPEEVKGRRLSCAQIAAANYQALTVNKQVAAHAATMLLQFITGELRYYALYFDQASGTARARYIVPGKL